MKPPLDLRHDSDVGPTAQLVARDMWWPIRSEDPQPVCWIPMEIFDRASGERIGGIFYESGRSKTAGYRALRKLVELGWVKIVDRVNPKTGVAETVYELTSSKEAAALLRQRQEEKAAATKPKSSKTRAAQNEAFPKTGMAESRQSIPTFEAGVPDSGKTIPTFEAGVPDSGNALVVNIKTPRDLPTKHESAGSSNTHIVATAAERSIVDQVLTEFAAARLGAGWSLPGKGYSFERDGVQALARVRDGETLETLRAAIQAAVGAAAESPKPRVREGAFFRPRTVFAGSNWRKWVRRDALAWLAAQNETENSAAPRKSADGSVILKKEISL